MNPADIPEDIMKLVPTAPWIGEDTFGFKLSENDAVTFLAHFWDDIVKHVRAGDRDYLTAKAAGYRLAADNVTELRAKHGDDYDAEMIAMGLTANAERWEQFACNAPRATEAEPVRDCGCPTRFDRHAWGCTEQQPAERPAGQGWDSAEFTCSRCLTTFTATTKDEFGRLYAQHKAECDHRSA